MGRQDADRIAADAEEHRVAEAHQPAIAQDHVEADGGDRPDDDARADRQQIALVEGLGEQRQDRQHQQDQRRGDAARRAQRGEEVSHWSAPLQWRILIMIAPLKGGEDPARSGALH